MEKKQKTNELGLEISAVICGNCKSIIFSRTNHDFHYCPCGKTFVDGGIKYIRIGYETEFGFKSITIRIKTTRDELYEDWNHRKNKFGIFSKK